MKIVIAPDTFKECLPAAEVAAELAKGVKLALTGAQIDLCPMADGGDGTAAALVSATGGRFVEAQVVGPMGRQVAAQYGVLGSSGAGVSRAVIEMARASGLALTTPAERNPLTATTFGSGQLLMLAMEGGAGEVLMGIGGSATVDGGTGCAQALGVTFIDKRGGVIPCGMGGGDLERIGDIDVSGTSPLVKATRIRVACDVTNPLTGPLGAAAVYGPQKGATPQMVERLEAGLQHLAEVIRRRLGVDIEHVPGAGAAGGLGAGLMAFAGATLERGLPMIAAAVGLADRLAGADLCITGEGKLDRSSRMGKTACGVAGFAARAGVPVVCVPGQAGEGAPADCFAAVLPLVADGVTPQQAMADVRELLALRGRQAVAKFIR